MNKTERENRIKELELELRNLKSGTTPAKSEKKVSFRETIKKSIQNEVIDIIEHRRMERRLLFISKAVESISDAVGISDVKGHHFYQNKAFSDLFEYETAEELEAAGGEAIVVKNKETANEIFSNILNGKSWAGELEMITKTGQVFSAFERADVIKDREGNITGFINVVTNISHYKQVESALKESETKFKEIINQINEGIFVYDQKGKIILWNKGAEKMIGMNTVDVINKDVVDIQYQFTSHTLKDKEYIENLIKNIVTIQSPDAFDRTYDIEIAEVKSGKSKNIQAIIFPIKFTGYDLFCVVFRDITKIKQYEKQLLQLNADKDRFISILAHDLKSPFNAFLGFSELLTEDIRQLDIEEIEDIANRLNKSARNTYNLLEDLLIWTRAQSGKIPFEPQQLSIAEISKNIIDLLTPNANTKKISINCLIPGGLNLIADIDMLKTIMRNLVSNAIKFTNQDGEIIIKAEEKSRNILISVTDNGIGIEPHNLTKLFDISQVLTTKGTAEEKGSGLGLLLCKEFVERHQGKIWVETNLGIGSTFTFSIPNHAII